MNEKWFTINELDDFQKGILGENLDDGNVVFAEGLEICTGDIIEMNADDHNVDIEAIIEEVEKIERQTQAETKIENDILQPQPQIALKNRTDTNERLEVEEEIFQQTGELEDDNKDNEEDPLEEDPLNDSEYEISDNDEALYEHCVEVGLEDFDKNVKSVVKLQKKQNKKSSQQTAREENIKGVEDEILREENGDDDEHAATSSVKAAREETEQHEDGKKENKRGGISGQRKCWMWRNEAVRESVHRSQLQMWPKKMFQTRILMILTESITKVL